ncbi:condensation domain-containing protein [Streptomyces sp. NPDC048297]|uniref:condensation domain-containing protein n=1 Tax=Streptomyces sp. NPDC048297 TaxID=3365531 RepID=UPI00371C26B0
MDDNITAAYLARYRDAVADDPHVAPVTGAQRRFLTLRSLSHGTAPVVVPLYFRFPRGTVDVARLEEAAACLAARHAALRMRFEVAASIPVQRLTDPRGFVRRVIAGPGENVAAALRRELLGWSADGPVLRLLLATGDDQPEDETLAVVVDHAACDEQSLGSLTDGLTRAYRERTSARDVRSEEGARAVGDYRDTVERQLAAERAASAQSSLDYWSERLSGLVPTGLALRTVTAGPGEDDDPTGMLQYRRPAAVGTERTALFPALLGATASAVASLASAAAQGDSTPLLGYPWGGRPLGAAPVMGCFLNTVLFTAGAPDDLDDVSDRWWDDIDHADTPLDEVLRVARKRGGAWSGALDALLTLEDTTRRPPLELGGVEGRETHLRGPALQSPLAVSVSQSQADLLVRMGWNRHQLAPAHGQTAFDALRSALGGHLDPAPDRPATVH